MRCLSLAAALSGKGARCLFVCREKGLGLLAGSIREAGHELLLLLQSTECPTRGENTNRTIWPAAAQLEDATACTSLLAGHPAIDWLVVDHYGLDACWESCWRPIAGRILVIDDLADRPHNCDMLLDQNLRDDAAPYADLIPETCRQLLGPRYALLRSEFSVAGKSARSRTAADTPRLLVMFGGADHDDLTGRVVRLMAKHGLSIRTDIVVGPLYAKIDQLRHEISALSEVTLHVAPPRIAELMGRADLAIGSPGTSSWERCSLALPTIAVAVADNQMAMAEILATTGAHLFLGDAETTPDSDLLAAIRLLIDNRPWRQHMAQAASALVDGMGADRVAARLLSGNVSVRTAEARDAAILFEWRNDPRTRRQSFDSSPLLWEKHADWLAGVLANRQQALLIGQKDGTDIGCVRFDLVPPQARVSIYLDPGRTGQGLAGPLLEAAASWLTCRHPDIQQQIAEIKAGNEASRRAFLDAGFRLDHTVFIK